jgi:hypothetical protein
VAWGVLECSYREKDDILKQWGEKKRRQAGCQGAGGQEHSKIFSNSQRASSSKN